MVLMSLKRSEKISMFYLDKKEADRLVKEAKKGETLFYECEEGRITLKEGVLYVDGFKNVPEVFGASTEDGYRDWRATFTRPLKELVKKIVVSEGTEALLYSFQNFPELEEVVLPDSIKYISHAFESSSKLKFFPFPEKLEMFTLNSESIYGHILQNFESIPEELVLPRNIKDVGETFQHSSVRSVVIPGSMSTVGSHAFYDCKDLESVIFEEGVTEIDNGAFSRCPKLDNVRFPRSMEAIQRYAFNNCTSLCHVEFASECNVSDTAFRDTPYEPLFKKTLFDKYEPVKYKEKMGVIHGFEEIKAALTGKKLSEQAEYFRVSANANFGVYSYGKETGGHDVSAMKVLWKYTDFENFIVKDGVVVGIVADGTNVIAGNCVCTYSASEDDGAGTKTREDYCTLVFCPEQKA